MTCTIRSLHFDVFGTVVDWRGSVIRELEAFGNRIGIDRNWPALADAWRALYQPSMEEVRAGRRPWTTLDVLHRESLVSLLANYGVLGLADEQVDDLNQAWHRLDPWPDVVDGLDRMAKRYTLATLSNGNVALMVDIARRSGLPWHAVLGAETARAYKPLPEAYLANARFLAHRPGQCLMVAAHNDDLVAACETGFRTAFVARPLEHGRGQEGDLAPLGDWDYVAQDFRDLAHQLGC